MATDGYEDIGTKNHGKNTGVARSGVPYWGDRPEDYDTVTIAGFDFPGICSVKGKAYEMRRKHQKAVGKHGVSTTYLANEPAEFVVTVMMTTEAHLRAFEKIIPIFKPSVRPKAGAKIGNPDSFTYAFTGQGSNTAKGSALSWRLMVQDQSQPGYLSIYHPLLALFRISHCRIIRCGLPEQKDDKGLWHVELHCIEEVLEGARKAVTGRTGDAGDIAGKRTQYDEALHRTPAPSKTNAGPPPK